MSCACPPLPPTADGVVPELPAQSPLERRLRGEWEILGRLAKENPGRITDVCAEDRTFRLVLRQTPGLLLGPAGGREPGQIATEHGIRLAFSRFFPAAPMELYLDHPVEHPNVHPETGFVCLWDRHLVSNTVEHALQKTVAILGWRLHNEQPVHVMQPSALRRMRLAGSEIAGGLASAPLLSSASPAVVSLRVPAGASERRRRLS